MGINSRFWKKTKVFVTGHTGFKGVWLCLLLERLGCHVSGYALPPKSSPNMFDLVGLKRKVESYYGDVRDLPRLSRSLAQVQPEIVVHMAAQALVRQSYSDPLNTFSTNVMGTTYILEAIRTVSSVKATVVVTSDKCYENRETGRAYVESDPMGGYDPYSSSKGCAELITAAYRCSFFQKRKVGIATARAGNVIGGGDWAADRLIPDLIRSATARQAVVIRYPASTRPWQFVLDPLSGYLTLAEVLTQNSARYSGAWNFGPDPKKKRTVRSVVSQAVSYLDGKPEIKYSLKAPLHEARNLVLNSSKARKELTWRPALSAEEAVEWTMRWYNEFLRGGNLENFTDHQIDEFLNL